jgi:hypothetical protein
MTTYEDIKQEFTQAITNGETLEHIRDYAHEWVDGYCPIYTNYIIQEWQDMPNDYDNRGAAELGYDGQDIVRLMSCDLFMYYSDLVALVLDDLAEELEDVA